jgi:hypothetical protein
LNPRPLGPQQREASAELKTRINHQSGHLKPHDPESLRQAEPDRDQALSSDGLSCNQLLVHSTQHGGDPVLTAGRGTQASESLRPPQAQEPVREGPGLALRDRPELLLRERNHLRLVTEGLGSRTLSGEGTTH